MSNKSDELDRLLKQSALKVEEDIEQLLAHEQTQVGNAMRLHRAEIADRRNLSLASFFSMFKAAKCCCYSCIDSLTACSSG